MISMVGAILGGLSFGLFSDRKGRRRAMVTAVLCALLLIPLWIFAPSTSLIIIGAFLMQFMVQGAWGVIPAHINELSPDAIRGFFPGFAYQTGVLCASSITYLQARMAELYTYSVVMGVSMIAVLILGAIVIGLGPERHSVNFGEELSP
jgi:SHS family lactate transporter-like MFS transporter